MSQLENGTPYRRVRLGVADLVLKDLRQRILSGQLSRGTQLPSEKELARHYQVSSPTIREAVRALSAMSLVDVRHGAGTFVTAESAGLMASAMTAVVQLEKISLLSILDMSEAFYLMSATLAVRQAGDQELAQLLATAERFTATMTAPEFSAQLREFLIGLVAVSHNDLLITIAGYLIEAQISLACDVAGSASSIWKKIAGQLIDERVAIAERLCRRYDAGAQVAIRRYMCRGLDLVREHAG